MIVFDQNEYVPCASNTRPDDCASATMPTRPERGMSCCAERRHGHTPLVAERLNSAEEKIRIILDRLIIFAGILPSLNTSDFKRLRIGGMKPVLAVVGIGITAITFHDASKKQPVPAPAEG
jgi:hypothetical protein